MPLNIAPKGENLKVSRIIGNEKVKRFLNSLGIIIGAEIKIISKIAGNMIINVKDTRIAINKELTSKILV